MDAISQKLLPYDQARPLLLNADLLLWRPTTLLGVGIARGTGGRYSHVGMGGWWHHHYECLHTYQWTGATPELLSCLVAKYPRVIDVYRIGLPDEETRVTVLDFMIGMMTRPYGKLAICKAALVNTRLTRAMWRKLFDATNDLKLNGSLPHCAQVVSIAVQLATGIDLKPGLAPFATSPNDLVTDTDLVQYVCTLDHSETIHNGTDEH